MPTTPTASHQSSSSPATNNLSNTKAFRVARQAGSVITFASFDPGTATGDHHVHAFRKLTLNEELCRPKRVVIETTPDGKSTWRFVPKARWEEGVESEGIWPRIVDVCGERQDMTQDEWDMYKLDPAYNCLIRKAPELSIITKSDREASVESVQKPGDTVGSPTTEKHVKFKRRFSEVPASRRSSGSGSDGYRKKQRPLPEIFSSSEGDDEDEEEEVNEMIIDDAWTGKRYLQSDTLKKVRANKEEARKRRSEWYSKRRQKLQEQADVGEDSQMSWTETPLSPPKRAKSLDPSGSAGKRKVESDISDSSDDDSDGRTPVPRFRTYEPVGNTKRTRTVSPATAQRELFVKRSTRGRRRQEEKNLRAQRRAQAKYEAEMKEIYEDAANFQPLPMDASNSGSSSNSSEATTPTDDRMDEEDAMRQDAMRQAMLEESKRKIAELEKDRPLWEERARTRAAREAEERLKAETARKAQAERERQEAVKEYEKLREKERAQEKERTEKEVAAAEVRSKRERARQAAMRDARAWINRGWTAAIALERYKQLSEAFDRANFFKGDVIVFETIPWPVLLRPGHFGVEDIDWTAVESFFNQMRRYVSAVEYRMLVEKSHKRFHPDRWRSRRVLQCVTDEEEKECLEVAANTVAQALTPLWQEVSGR